MPRDTSVSVRYSFAEALFDDFRREGPTAILFVKTGRRIALGQDLTVVVEFPAERRSFRLRGQVVSSRRGSKEPPLPAGIEVAFPSSQHHTIQMVLDHASGKQVDFVERKSKRVPCALEVTYRTDEGFVREFAEDLSQWESNPLKLARYLKQSNPIVRLKAWRSCASWHLWARSR